MSSIFSAITGTRSTSTPTSPPPTRPSVSSSDNRAPATPQQRTAEARAAFDASLKSAGVAHLDSELQARAKNIHENAAKLDEQNRRVRNESDALAMEGNSVEKMLDRTEQNLNLRKAGGGGGMDGGEKRLPDQFEDEIAALEKDLDFLDDMLDDMEGNGPHK